VGSAGSASRARTRSAERARRRSEVDFAQGNVRHEVGILSDETERLNAAYVAGEIDSDELTAAILASNANQRF